MKGKVLVAVMAAAALALLVGCGGVTSGPSYDALNAAKADFEKATALGMKACTPCEYAKAEAELEFAEHQLNELRIDRFRTHLAKANAMIAEGVDKLKLCKVIYFDFDKYVIRPEFYPILYHMADTMLKYEDVNVEIQGHTCSIGTERYNCWLGQKRADSVKDALTLYEVPEERLTTVSWGEYMPAESNATEAGRIKNRRVEFEIIYK
jgi:outer membrane protein OmpA-like peptidoglycan-associated protein